MSRKKTFLGTLDREHETTRRVLRAFPTDQLDLRPHPRSNSARELGWTFALERRLGIMVWNDEFANGMPASKTPPPPESWAQVLDGIDAAHTDYRALLGAASEDDLDRKVTFFTAPKTMGQITRHEWIWFLLHDEIHHRGQFSIYIRMAGGKVPSIYGPSADEPWM